MSGKLRLRAAVGPLVVGAQNGPHARPRRGPDVVAHDLECRLLSPCCYREIVARVYAGEAPARIEADLVRRYGPAVRALPPGRDPRWEAALVPALALVFGLAVLVRVRRRASRPARDAATRPGEPDYEDRLDDELGDLE